MKLSEVAKELGYTVAELVWFARKQSLAIESTKAEVPPRTAALLRAQIPTKKKLKEENAELLEQIKAGAEEVKKSEGTAPRTRVRKPAAPKKEGEAAPAAPPKEKAKPAAEPKVAPPAPAPKPAPPKRKIQEIKLSEIDRLVGGAKPPGARPAAPPPKPREITQDVQEKIKAAEEALRAHKPLIDISAEKEEVRTVRAEVPALETEAERLRRERLERREAGPRRPAAAAPARPARKQPRPPRAILEAMRPRKPVRPASEREVSVVVPITIKDLSQEIGIKSSQLIVKLMEHGIRATINTALDKDAVEMMGLEFNRKVKIREQQVLEQTALMTHEDTPERLKPRAPVVTVMGHVDHGKTTLLDKIRQTNVAAGEAGGITQSIAAYKVRTRENKEVVFIDTPGHQAFTAMRARGANVTDVVVLVVAADDGVMPQTVESINHARAAEVPIVVALNKIDKPEANVHRVKQQLAQNGLNPEEWGGDTVVVEVSAQTGQGIPQFLELLALQADLQELKANPDREADGTILEVLKSDSRGIVGTVIVQGGTLHRGDSLICGAVFGRVRSMHDDRGQEIAEAGPATPVQITGLEEIPEVGARFSVVKDIKAARALAEERGAQVRQTGRADRPRVTLENIFDTIEAGKAKELNVVLKTDVKGSMEVLSETLKGLTTQELHLKLIHAGVGTVNSSDVDLAVASGAVIIGFNVGVESRAATQAEENGVQIRRHDVIYTLLEEVQAALEGLLEPEEVQTVVGTLRVKEVFRTSRGGVAGCLVTQGKVERSARVRLKRAGKELFNGRIASLRRFKDDVREVAEGFECGLKIEGFEDVQKEDVIEAYTIEKVPRKVYQRQ